MANISAKEKEMAKRLEELNRSSIDASNPFKCLASRMRLRSSYENIAREYLYLIENKSGSTRCILDLLYVMESMRAPDIARQLIRIAPIGPRKRQRWKNSYEMQCHHSQQHSLGSFRTFRSSFLSFSEPFSNQQYIEGIDLVNPEYKNESILNLTDVLIIHYGFINDDLVIILDSNLEYFVYGAKAVSDRKIHWKSFNDYGYNPSTQDLDPDRIVCGPIVRKKVRGGIIELAIKLNEHIEKFKNLDSMFFHEIMTQLEKLVGYDQLFEEIQNWAHSKNRSLKDICLLSVPDESLYILPLGFLGITRGESLITSFGGFANALSLLALKWSIKDFHQTTFPNQNSVSPRCVMLAANSNPYESLNLYREMGLINETFGSTNCLIIGDAASRIDFLSNYSAGDVCWFSGHGIYDLSQGIEIEGELIPFPLTGPAFSDGVLTNWDLISTSKWNFKSLWLTVMNCCLLSRVFLAGPNPLGFVSALHTAGSIATIAALWPVSDNGAINFAKHLSEEIVKNFNAKDFPRARALSSAIRKITAKDNKSLCEYSPYVLWGVP